MSAELEARTNDLLEKIVSSETGIIRSIRMMPTFGGQIPHCHYAATTASFAALPTAGDIDQPGGSSWNPTYSRTQMAFETLERYCGAFVDEAKMITTVPRGEMFEAGIRQQRFDESQYADPGFPFGPVSDTEPINWVAGRSLIDGGRRFIPAPLVYVPYWPASRTEWLGPSFSTGMAGGWSLDQALQGGLLEVVERDAFTITWLNRLERPRLVAAPDSTLERQVAGIESDGVTTVTFVDLTTDIDIPVVAAVLVRPMFGRPLPTVGVSCKTNVSQACEKALAEAVSEYERLLSELHPSRGADHWVAAPDFADVVDFEWHGRAYIDPSMHPHLDFMLEGEVHEIDGEPQAGSVPELSELVRTVAAHASDIVSIELTTRDVAELGARVVKVFVPELVPLHADHRYPYLGHGRFVNAGGVFPDRTAAEAIAAVNPYPHPFS